MLLVFVLFFWYKSVFVFKFDFPQLIMYLFGMIYFHRECPRSIKSYNL